MAHRKKKVPSENNQVYLRGTTPSEVTKLGGMGRNAQHMYSEILSIQAQNSDKT